ncbi:MAG: CRISPR system precrRNA processing endoribonuclease RAMP protein Cas6 [Capsulimonadaceae bacterium]
MPTTYRFSITGPPPATPYDHIAGQRALVLDWVRQADPVASAALHDSNQAKPYAVSPIWTDERGTMSFEVSVLVEWLEETLLAGIGDIPRGIRLGPAQFRIEGVDVAAKASWPDLLRTPSPPSAHWAFQVLTPAAHHAAGEFRKAVVLPTAENYFGSWMGRWNLASGAPLSDDLRQVIVERMAVSHCAGRTVDILLDGSSRSRTGRTFIGFIGDVTFSLLQPHSVPCDALAALTALARLSRFCGTGVETARGMGQTRYIA